MVHLIRPNDSPDPIECFVGALEVIEMIHGAVNEEPVLFETGRSKNGVASEPAELERGRRGVHRGLYRKLSKYYPRTKGLWTQPGLLKKGKLGRILCADDTFTHPHSHQWWKT